jgi:hypothetical protein
MPLYRNIRTEAPEYEPLPFYTSEVEEEMDLATWLREASTNRQTETAVVAGDGEEPSAFAVVGENTSGLADDGDLAEDFGRDGSGDVAAGD